MKKSPKSTTAAAPKRKIRCNNAERFLGKKPPKCGCMVCEFKHELFQIKERLSALGV